MIGTGTGETYKDELSHVLGMGAGGEENNSPAASGEALRAIVDQKLRPNDPEYNPRNVDQLLLPPGLNDETPTGDKIAGNNKPPPSLQRVPRKEVPIQPSGNEDTGKGFVPGSGARIGSINNMYHVPSGSISDGDGNVFIDHRIPGEFADSLAEHETEEARLMKPKEEGGEGLSYEDAHKRATIAEAKVAMASGRWGSWNEYTEELDKYVVDASKGPQTNLPPITPHVPYEKADGHHESLNKEIKDDENIVNKGTETAQGFMPPWSKSNWPIGQRLDTEGKPVDVSVNEAMHQQTMEAEEGPFGGVGMFPKADLDKLVANAPKSWNVQDMTDFKKFMGWFVTHPYQVFQNIRQQNKLEGRVIGEESTPGHEELRQEWMKDPSLRGAEDLGLTNPIDRLDYRTNLNPRMKP